MKLLDLDYDCFGEIYKFLDDESRCNLLAATLKTEWIRGVQPFIQSDPITICFGPKKQSSNQSIHEDQFKLMLATLNLRFNVHVKYVDADFFIIYDILKYIGKDNIAEKIIDINATTLNFNSRIGNYSIPLQCVNLFNKLVSASFTKLIPRYLSSLTRLTQVKFISVEFGADCWQIYQLPIETLELYDCAISMLPKSLKSLKAVNSDLAEGSIIAFPLGLRHLHLENIRGGYWMLTLQEVSKHLESLTMLNPAVENFILKALRYPKLKYLEMNSPSNLKSLKDCKIDHVVLHDRFGKFSVRRRNGKLTKKSKLKIIFRHRVTKNHHFEDGSIDTAVSSMSNHLVQLRQHLIDLESQR